MPANSGNGASAREGPAAMVARSSARACFFRLISLVGQEVERADYYTACALAIADTALR